MASAPSTKKRSRDTHVQWDRIWKDSNGHWALWQTPNTPLLIWISFTIVAHFLSASHLKTGVEFTASAFLFVWAYLEISSGVSYFRRGLGVVIMAMVLVGHFIH